MYPILPNKDYRPNNIQRNKLNLNNPQNNINRQPIQNSPSAKIDLLNNNLERMEKEISNFMNLANETMSNLSSKCNDIDMRNMDLYKIIDNIILDISELQKQLDLNSKNYIIYNAKEQVESNEANDVDTATYDSNIPDNDETQKSKRGFFGFGKEK